MCILCIRFIFWSFGVAQTAAALVASGVALHVRVDNAPYRMISKQGWYYGHDLSRGAILLFIYYSPVLSWLVCIFCTGCVTRMRLSQFIFFMCMFSLKFISRGVRTMGKGCYLLA